MQITAHAFATFALIYLCLGCSLWVLLDAGGIVEQTIEARVAARGAKPTMAALSIATSMMILAWPVFVFGFLAGLVSGICKVVRRMR